MLQQQRNCAVHTVHVFCLVRAPWQVESIDPTAKGLPEAAPSDPQHELYLSTNDLCSSSSSSSVQTVKHTRLQLAAADTSVLF